MNFKSTDPRDKILATIGISSPCPLVGPFKANYLMSLDEVLLYTARYLMLTPEWDLALSISGRGYHKFSVNGNSTALPSWVPGWTSTNILGARGLPTYWAEAPRTFGKVTMTTDLLHIRVRGHYFDTIEK
jgi:hypothetical protein